MKNILKILFILLFALMFIVACTPDKGNNKPDSENTNTETPDNVVGWPDVVVAYYRGNAAVSISNLENRFVNVAGITLATNGGTEDDNLFIVGPYDNDLSAKAYWQMDRDFSCNENNTIYTIYSDGKSIAIAYESEVALYAALEYFFTEYGNVNFTKPGVIVSHEFHKANYINEVHSKNREDALAAMQGQLSDEAINELRNLYDLYDERTYYWLANLWDPDFGGFYYSNSARDTMGFLPDLESTAQALLFLTDSGMLTDYNDKYRYALPSSMAESILNYAKNSQDPTNGYFYHEQWGDSVSTARLGRDLGWATRIISGFGSVPYWNTPNGVRGEYGAPGSAPLSARSAEMAAAPVLFASSKPKYLTSVELFIKHLENDFDWDNDSYAAGNEIESELGQIQAAGKEFTDALIEFLNSKQKSNGLWENTVSYDSINGLMKISGVYTSLRQVIPNADKAMDSAIVMLKSDTTATHVCSVYNPWEAVANILISIEKISGKDEADKLRAQFRNDAADLIKITAEKLAVFKKNDGGFSYFIRFSAATSQGASVAVNTSVESDVNATMICTNSIITSMFDVFGLERVDRYYAIDYASFYDTLYDLGTIIKDEMPKTGPIIFDDYDAEYGEEQNGVIMYPDGNSHTIIADEEKGDDGLFKWFQNSIVENPDPNAEEDDLVLHTQSFVYPGTAKPLADKASSTNFTVVNANMSSAGDCYVYDADMYFVPGYGKTNSSGVKTSDPILQIFFMTDNTTCASVNVSVYTENGVDYVKIGENFAGIDGKDSNVAGGIPMGEWVNIRLEYYKLYEVKSDGKEVYTPKLKVYVNGVYKGECDATYTGTQPTGEVYYYDRKISIVKVSYYRFLASEVYFNNVVAERCKIDYVAEVNPDDIVDPPLPEEEMRESYGFEDGLLNTSNVANKVRVYDFGVAKYINATEGQMYNPYISYSIVADPANAANHVLKVVATRSSEFDKPSRTEVNLHKAAANGTDYIFSGKFYYPSDSIGTNGDVTQLFFLDSLEAQAYSLRIEAKKVDGVFTLNLIENNEAGTGSGAVIYSGIPCDQWFELKVVFHRTRIDNTTGAGIYLNGNLVVENMTYNTAALGNNPITKVALVHQRTNSSTLYLDDLSFSRSGEVVEQVESEDKVAGFTDGFNTKYVHNYTFKGATQLGIEEVDPITLETLFTKFYLIVDPKDAANQVLRAVNKNGGTNAGYTRVDVSNDNPAGDCYVFETKLFLETYSAGYNVAEFKLVDVDGNSAFSIYMSVDKTSGFVKLSSTGSGAYPEAGTNLIEGTGIELTGGKETGEWFTLRLEYYNKGVHATSDNTFLKLYINDVLAYDGLAYRTLGAEISHVDIVHCKTNKSSAVYYDDISLSRIEKEYVAEQK